MRRGKSHIARARFQIPIAFKHSGICLRIFAIGVVGNLGFWCAPRPRWANFWGD